MKPLPLRSSGLTMSGFDDGQSRAVIRLGPASSKPRDPAVDAAIIRTSADAALAVQGGFALALILSGAEQIAGNFQSVIRVPADFEYLDEGDVLGLDPASGRVRVLYRRNSSHNAFLVTERCNHYCLMCSQPPKHVDDNWILDEIAEAILLVDKSTISIGFTGGEPLLEWRRFIRLIELARDQLPKTKLHVLTNGRAFASSQVTAAWAATNHPDLCAGIPIYSALDHLHDYVVQAKGAFDETVLGILKLKDKGQRVEIRVVLHKLTAPRIVETCTWIARNLPFVDHVALMGLENTGFALANQELLWIDPLDFKADLAVGVDILNTAGVHVSVYNLQRCVLDRSVWPFAVRSISDWKNAFVSECASCVERDRCSGFFSTGRPRMSVGIAPIHDCEGAG